MLSGGRGTSIESPSYLADASLQFPRVTFKENPGRPFLLHLPRPTVCFPSKSTSWNRVATCERKLCEQVTSPSVYSGRVSSFSSTTTSLSILDLWVLNVKWPMFCGVRSCPHERGREGRRCLHVPKTDLASNLGIFTAFNLFDAQQSPDEERADNKEAGRNERESNGRS